MKVEEKKIIRQQLGDNLKKYRELLGLTKVKVAQELSQKVGRNIDSSALSNWEKGVYSPELSLLVPLCEVLHCKINDLFDNNRNNNSELQPYFDQLSARQKETVKTIVKSQLGITTSECIIPLKLYNQSACAGDGNYIDCEEYEIVEYVNPPKTAEFTIKVQGDSMEPLIKSGDIVYINPHAQLQDKEFGIFSYQGETFVKQLRISQDKLYLHSLNSKYKDIEIQNPDEFFICGRVL